MAFERSILTDKLRINCVTDLRMQGGNCMEHNDSRLLAQACMATFVQQSKKLLCVFWQQKVSPGIYS